MARNVNKATKILWWVAGANPEILQEYPSEQPKFSAIGMTILMTCLVAFVSGYAAGWYFSEESLPSFLFGLLWAVLIFCIDRSLVVTMKKKPGDPWWKVLWFIIPRALLAVLVAMLMSIPLELLVFEDLINQELPNYIDERERQAQTLGASYENQMRLDQREENLNNQKATLTKDIQDLNKKIEKKETEIKNIQNNINGKENEIKSPSTSAFITARNTRQKLGSSLSETMDREQRSEIQRKISQQDNIMAVEKNKKETTLRPIINQLEADKKSKESELAVLRTKLEEKEKNDLALNEMILSNTQNIARVDSMIRMKQDTIANKTSGSNKFILHYGVLNYAVKDKVTYYKKKKSQNQKDSTIVNQDDAEIILDNNQDLKDPIYDTYEQVEEWRNKDAFLMLWLIRALFFIFEMMPTLVKAVSNTGAYERRIQADEKNIASYLSSTEYSNHIQELASLKIKHEKELEEERLKAERKLHDEWLEKILQAQREVAEHHIQVWKRNNFNNSSQSSSTSQLPPSQTQTNKPETSTPEINDEFS